MFPPQGPGASGRGHHRTERCQGQRVPAGSSPRRFEFIRQDEFPEFGSSRVALGGNVHVRGVRSQQPGTLQAERDTLSAAVNLQDNAQGSQVRLTEKCKDLSHQHFTQQLARVGVSTAQPDAHHRRCGATFDFKHHRTGIVLEKLVFICSTEGFTHMSTRMSTRMSTPTHLSLSAQDEAA